METPRPYVESRMGSTIIREFRGDVGSDELIWHQDRKDRRITVLEGSDWKLQLEEGLPFPLIEGNTYGIPARSWHRLIKGRGNLRIRILEAEMRITESKLRQIIREEAKRLIEHEQILVRRKGKTYVMDDEGNEEFLDNDPEEHGLYDDGESVPYRRGSGYSSRSDSWSRDSFAYGGKPRRY